MWDLSGRLVLNLKSGFKLPRSLAHGNWQIDAFLPNYFKPCEWLLTQCFIRWGGKKRREEWSGILFSAQRYNLVKDLGPWAEWSRENHDFMPVCFKHSSCRRKKRKSFRWYDRLDHGSRKVCLISMIQLAVSHSQNMPAY